MTPGQEAHLAAILSEARTILDAKYRRGQVEHGGNLWEKPGLLDEAIQEAADQLIYLLTLRRRSSGVAGVTPAESAGLCSDIPSPISPI